MGGRTIHYCDDMMTLDLRKVEIKIKKDMNKQVRLQAAYLKE